jgi:SpoVK/Ycf46/Vps4 family AAA+-type ATPase
LVDDAFLRRMGYRLYVNPPDKEMYTKIFQQYVESNGFGYDAKHLDFVYRLYDADKRPLRACEPRDLMLRCADHCKYENLPKTLSNEIILLAWKNYFGAEPTLE